MMEKIKLLSLLVSMAVSIVAATELVAEGRAPSTISRSLSFREGTYPGKDYQQFRTFLESVTKASTTSIVYR